MLVDELCDRILQDPSRAHLIGDGWWRQRWRHSLDGDTPLAREVISAAVLHLDSGDRLDLVERVLDAVPHADDPRALTGSLTRMLWARHSPTHAELRILVKVVPRDTELDPEIFQSLCDELLAQEAGPAGGGTRPQPAQAGRVTEPEQRRAQTADGGLPAV